MSADPHGSIGKAGVLPRWFTKLSRIGMPSFIQKVLPVVSISAWSFDVSEVSKDGRKEGPRRQVAQSQGWIFDFVSLTMSNDHFKMCHGFKNQRTNDSVAGDAAVININSLSCDDLSTFGGR
jgi:hypothetical protein